MKTIGFLHTGPVMRRPPTPASFQRSVAAARGLDVDITTEQATRAHFETPIIPRNRPDSPAALLASLPKLFHEAAETSFTEFVSRTRMGTVEKPLRNPNLRVRGIGFTAESRSPTHFNRMFRTVAGEWPTKFRSRLPRPAWRTGSWRSALFGCSSPCEPPIVMR